jgi:hypothetical protein
MSYHELYITDITDGAPILRSVSCVEEKNHE